MSDTILKGRSECLTCNSLLDQFTGACKCATKPKHTLYVPSGDVCISCDNARCTSGEFREAFNTEGELEAHLCSPCWGKVQGVTNFFERQRLHAMVAERKKDIERSIKVMAEQWHKNERIKKYKELRVEIEQMPVYKKWREDVLQKFDHKCMVCGSPSDIEVDHRYYSFYSIIQLHNITSTVEAYECRALWDVSNGAPLCKVCHSKTASSQTYRKLNPQ